MVIDRYRETTAALGYSGDSVINSLSDIAMMALGFLAARKLPRVGGDRCLLLALEIVPLFVIRDNLTLNVWQLLAPNEALQAWQAGVEGTIAERSVVRTTLRQESLLKLRCDARAPCCWRGLPAGAHAASCSAASMSTTSRRRSTTPASKAAWTSSLGYRGGRIGHRDAAPALRVRRAQHRRRHQLRRGRPVGQVSLGGRSMFGPASASRSTTARPANSTAPTRSPSAAACCSSPSSASARQINGRLSVEASWVHMSHAPAVRPAESRASTISASA